MAFALKSAGAAARFVSVFTNGDDGAVDFAAVDGFVWEVATGRDGKLLFDPSVDGATVFAVAGAAAVAFMLLGVGTTDATGLETMCLTVSVFGDRVDGAGVEGAAATKGFVGWFGLAGVGGEVDFATSDEGFSALGDDAGAGVIAGAPGFSMDDVAGIGATRATSADGFGFDRNWFAYAGGVEAEEGLLERYGGVSTRVALLLTTPFGAVVTGFDE